jgi:hypothetical protein
MSALGQNWTHAPEQKASLFDYLVGAHEQHWRHCNSEGLGGFDVDDELELLRLQDWKLVRFGAAIGSR